MSPLHLLCGLSYIPRSGRAGEALSRPDQGWGSRPSETFLFSFPGTFVHSHCPLAGAGFQFSLKEESDVTVRDAGGGGGVCPHILVLRIQYQRTPFSATCSPTPTLFDMQLPQRLALGAGISIPNGFSSWRILAMTAF